MEHKTQSTITSLPTNVRMLRAMLPILHTISRSTLRFLVLGQTCPVSIRQPRDIAESSEITGPGQCFDANVLRC